MPQLSKVSARYDMFAYFSNSFISGESMVIEVKIYVEVANG